MDRIPVELVVRGIRKTSQYSMLVDLTIDGATHQFRFNTTRLSQLEQWIPGRSPFPIRQNPKFVAVFKKIKGRPEILALMARVDGGEQLDFPIRLASSRRP